jgi:alkylation response protein AidB-like acyl-CoA dehydrogenase
MATDSPDRFIRSPDDAALDDLCATLAEHSSALDVADNAGDYPWPARQLALCGEYGVFSWFIEASLGGQGWSDVDLARGYLRLSASCLATTFVITQRTAACRRIAGSVNSQLQQQLLPDLVSGASFSTVGISHLTTSHRHLDKPVLRAEQIDSDIVLDGFTPWVTGAEHADTIVVGASMDDGRQLLAVVPTGEPGLKIDPAIKLMALSASHTGRVRFEQLRLSNDYLLAGPAENVMAQGSGAMTGGLQTSTLAVGLAAGAVRFLQQEAAGRVDLAEATSSLHQQQQELEAELLSGAAGNPTCSTEELRRRANNLVIHCTQAALAAAKGAGYVQGHPVGRWCREALFFLVWSCPQPVMQAHLCELAGIAE